MTRSGLYQPLGIMRRTLQVVGLVLVGCQSTHEDGKQAAVERWNHMRAQVKARLAADQLAEGNLAKASAELAEAYGLDPTNPELTPLLARVRLANGDSGYAQRLLAGMKGSGPAQAEVEYLRGVIFQQQEKWDRALECFVQATEHDPDEVAYLVALSQTFLQLGLPEEARRRLEARESVFGWKPAYHAALAECHEPLDQWAEAASAWRKVVDRAPDAADIRERFAMALYRAGNCQEAVAVLEQVVDDPKFEPSDVLRLALAECLVEDGQLAAGRYHVAQVLARDERSLAALHLLARILTAEGTPYRALQTARHAMAIDPDNVRSVELSAALACRVGDAVLADELAGRLLDVQADNAIAHRIRALRKPAAARSKKKAGPKPAFGAMQDGPDPSRGDDQRSVGVVRRAFVVGSRAVGDELTGVRIVDPALAARGSGRRAVEAVDHDRRFVYAGDDGTGRNLDEIRTEPEHHRLGGGRARSSLIGKERELVDDVRGGRSGRERAQVLFREDVDRVPYDCEIADQGGLAGAGGSPAHAGNRHRGEDADNDDDDDQLDQSKAVGDAASYASHLNPPITVLRPLDATLDSPPGRRHPALPYATPYRKKTGERLAPTSVILAPVRREGPAVNRVRKTAMFPVR